MTTIPANLLQFYNVYIKIYIKIIGHSPAQIKIPIQLLITHSLSHSISLGHSMKILINFPRTQSHYTLLLIGKLLRISPNVHTLRTQSTGSLRRSNTHLKVHTKSETGWTPSFLVNICFTTESIGV